MALHAIDEALRNLTAIGGDPTRTGLIDNFCWGDPRQPETLGRLVRAAQGCHDAALALKAPFVSGKDSLYNEYTAADGRRHSIPDTLLITAVAPMTDIRRMVTSDLKAPDNVLYLVGETGAELGGSLLSLLYDDATRGTPQVPRVDLALSRRIFVAVARAIRKGLICSCHDCAEGGVAVALAEMAIGGRLGATMDLASIDRREGTLHNASPAWADAALIFSESPTRFVMEVCPSDASAFEATLAGLPIARIGRVLSEPTLHIDRGDDAVILTLPLAELATAWKTPLEPQPGAHEPWAGAAGAPRTPPDISPNHASSGVRWGHVG